MAGCVFGLEGFFVSTGNVVSRTGEDCKVRKHKQTHQVARCVAEALKGWNESTFGNVYQKV